MQPIDVVLVGTTGMLSHVLKTILDEPGIRLRAEYSLEQSVVSAVAAVEPDVVILATEGRGLPSVVRDLLGERPPTKVLTIRDDGRQTCLHELRPHETELGQVSPQLLLETVRKARTRPA